MPTPENEQKIRYLSRYRRMNARIDRLLDEKRRWWELALKITPSLSQAPGGGENGSRVERPMDKITEIEAQITREIEELCNVRQKIKEILAQLEDENLRLLMEYRYIDGLTWEQIAEKMDCSRQWATSLHGKALLQITCF